jgi:hypothetical protein
MTGTSFRDDRHSCGIDVSMVLVRCLTSSDLDLSARTGARANAICRWLKRWHLKVEPPFGSG